MKLRPTRMKGIVNMGTRYVINTGHGYYDEKETDARGYPLKKWSSSGSSFESNKEPEVGDSCIFEKDGKLFRRVVISVHFNDCVWEDTESYDVEYSTTEIKPDELVIDTKWVLNKKSCMQEPKYGVFNGRGKIVVPYEYDEIENIMPNILKVRKGKKWGAIDSTNGSFIFRVSFESIERSGDYWKIKQGNNIS